MDGAKRQAFEGLQALAHPPGVDPKCKVCMAPTRLFDAVDFNKCCSSAPYCFGLSGIQVSYYRCDSCRFIFTDLIDDWSSEEVSEFIYNADYVKVDPDYIELRPRRTAEHLAPPLSGCKDARILDYGSGSGVFAEAMGAQGFTRVESYDPFSSPTKPSGKFDLITCIEVLEHSAQPLKTLTELAEWLSQDGAILVGQTLQPENIEEIAGRWWYLAPRNGHVSLFAHETFIALAGRAGLKYQGGSGLFAFTRAEVAAPIGEVIKLVRGGMSPEVGRRLARATRRWKLRWMLRWLTRP